MHHSQQWWLTCFITKSKPNQPALSASYIKRFLTNRQFYNLQPVRIHVQLLDTKAAMQEKYAAQYFVQELKKHRVHQKRAGRLFFTEKADEKRWKNTQGEVKRANKAIVQAP